MVFDLFTKNSSLLASLLLAGSSFFAHPAIAQQVVTSELGAGLGGTTYRGEVSPRYRFLNNRPALTVFYRRDLSAALTARANLTIGSLAAADATVRRSGTTIPVAASRNAEFKGSVLEIMTGFEYNFLDYYDLKRRIRWSPYFFLGVAGYRAPTTTTFRQGPGAQEQRLSDTHLSVAVPVGVGIKYALTDVLNLGIEAGARRTFGDDLDNLSRELPPALAQPADPDWYFYNGISLSYTFYNRLCPAVYKGQPRLLR